MNMDRLIVTFPSIWEWWNDHDSGIRPWTSLSFGTVCIQKAAAYTVGLSDHVVLVDSTAATRAITLPTAVGVNGRRYTVKDWKGKSATNAITVGTTSTQTIDGSATKVLNTNYESVTFVSDGAGWSII